MDYLWGSAFYGQDALSSEQDITGALLAHGQPWFEVVNRDEASSALFAKAMEEFSSTRQYQIDTLIRHFDWERLGSGLMVDVRIPRPAFVHALT